KEAGKIIFIEVFRIKSMGFQNIQEFFVAYTSMFFDFGQVFTWRITTDNTVSTGIQRSFVNNTVIIALGNTILFTPGYRENMMNINRLRKVGGEINAGGRKPVFRIVIH